MLKKKFSTILLIICLSSGVFLAHAEDLITTPYTTSVENRFKPRIELTGKLGYSSKKGGSRNIGRLGFTLPIFQKMNSVLFLSIIGMKDTARHIEGNFGAGYRTLFNPNWIIGGYGFYDMRKTQNNNYLKQATLGIEALLANDCEYMNVDWNFLCHG